MQELVNPAWRPRQVRGKMSTTFEVWINLPIFLSFLSFHLFHFVFIL